MRYLCIITLLCVPLLGFGQKDVSRSKTNTLVINQPEITVKCEVLKNNDGIKAKDEMTYHWYKADKIMETKGGFEGKLLHGSYTEFYKDHNLKQKAVFIYGLKDGEWKSWHPNGQIKEIVYYKNGMKNGEYKAYDVNGNPTLEANYKGGKLDGETVSYSEGKVLKKTLYKDGEEVIPEEKQVRVKTKKVKAEKAPKQKKVKPAEKKELKEKEPAEDKKPEEKIPSGEKSGKED